MKDALGSIFLTLAGASVTALVGCASQSAPASPTTAPTAQSEPTRSQQPKAGNEADTADADPTHHGHAHRGHAHDDPEDPPHGAEHPHGRAGDSGYQMDFSQADRFASHFDDPKRDAWQRPAEVLTLLSIEPGMVVADLGAGTGYFVGRLSKAVGSAGKVLALDVEPNMVEHVEKRAKNAGLDNVMSKTVAPDDPGLAPGGVDRVLIVNTWHHIGARESYARKLRSGLEPGGYVLVVDFTAESDIGPPGKHRLTPEQVVRELEAGGLRASVLDESLPKQYVVKGERP